MPETTLGPTVRRLDAEDLDIGFVATAATGRASSVPDAPVPDDADPEIREMLDLLDTYSGLILTGPPGTSKTYYAHSVAVILSDGDHRRRAFTQFHPSYQYEDFMEGWRPKAGGGYERRLGVFLALCAAAAESPDHPHVLVIDELSRGDAARVFGEALTYVERSKRGLYFELPSGALCHIPPNVYVIATMNPLDRGVDEVDAAFERRFAKKALLPNAELLKARLAENGLDEGLRSKVLAWFRDINGQQDPAAHLGHAYFWDVTDEATLRAAWEYQIQYHVSRAFRYNEPTRMRLTEKWTAMYPLSQDLEGSDGDRQG